MKSFDCNLQNSYLKKISLSWNFANFAQFNLPLWKLNCNLLIDLDG